MDPIGMEGNNLISAIFPPTLGATTDTCNWRYKVFNSNLRDPSFFPCSKGHQGHLIHICTISFTHEYIAIASNIQKSFKRLPWLPCTTPGDESIRPSGSSFPWQKKKVLEVGWRWSILVKGKFKKSDSGLIGYVFVVQSTVLLYELWL